MTWKQVEGEKSDRENKIIWIISSTSYEVIALCLQLLGVYQIISSYSVKYQVNFLKAERQGETLSVESYWISRDLKYIISGDAVVVSNIPFMCMRPDMEMWVQWEHKSIKVRSHGATATAFFVCCVCLFFGRNEWVAW